MLAGQALNEQRFPIYSCVVNGQNWYFMALKDQEYAISKAYFSTTSEGLLNIFRILKGVKEIILGLVN